MKRNQRAFHVEEAARSGPGVDDGVGKELTGHEKPTKVSFLVGGSRDLKEPGYLGMVL